MSSPRPRPVQSLNLSAFSVEYLTWLFLFPTQDMIEVEIVAEVDTVMGVHVYI